MCTLYIQLVLCGRSTSDVRRYIIHGGVDLGTIMCHTGVMIFSRVGFIGVSTLKAWEYFGAGPYFCAER